MGIRARGLVETLIFKSKKLGFWEGERTSVCNHIGSALSRSQGTGIAQRSGAGAHGCYKTIRASIRASGEPLALIQCTSITGICAEGPPHF